MPADRKARLTEFFRRLQAAPPASSATEAYRQLARVLNAVEDELSGVPYNPNAWMGDGRIHPPQEDAQRPVPGRPDLLRYRTKGHNVLIRGNGAVQIRTVSGEAVFEKAGADGQGVNV